MTDENKTEETESVFDQAEIVEDLPVEEGPSADEAPASAEEKEWSANISSESPKDRLERKGVKAEADGRVLTIKGYSFTRPKTKSMDGSHIEPSRSQDGTKAYYPGKLSVKFEEDNLVEYYPNFKYFVGDDGSINNTAKVNRGGDNSVTKLFNLAVAKIGKPADEVSDKEAWDFLVGKKVKMKTESGTYMKKKWFRNNIVSIED